MKRHLTTILALLVAAAGLAFGGVGLATADREVSSHGPSGDTIVAVRGSAHTGFTIRRYDGRREYLPTQSEAAAECREYDSHPERVRCWTEVRVWYGAVRELKRSIAYQKSLRR